VEVCCFSLHYIESYAATAADFACYSTFWKHLPLHSLLWSRRS
jgi:hypothetical protein